MSSPATLEATGFTRLHEPALGINVTANVIFVHGLNGHPRDTWSYDETDPNSKKAIGPKIFWPADRLPVEVPAARVWTYGHNASASQGFWGQKLENSFSQLGDDMKIKLERDLQNDDRIIFVAHSLGGLVIKRALLSMKIDSDPKYHHCLRRVYGVIFCGTPHRGSSYAKLADFFTSGELMRILVAPNTTLVQDLKTGGPHLLALNTDFGELVRGSPIKIHSFQENLAPRFLRRKVVPDFSSTVGCSGEAVEIIDADHREMVRQAGVKQITGCIKVFTNEVTELANAPAATAPPEAMVNVCLSDLAYLNMDSRSKDVVVAENGTCNWILQNPKYINWLAGDRGLIWIQGKPGSGKSTVLRHALRRYTEDKRRDNRQVILSFFLHGRGAPLQKTPLGLYRSLLHQLLQRFPTQTAHVVEYHQRHLKTHGSCGVSWDWHVRDLKDMLKTSLASIVKTHSVTVFVDALDESGEDNARQIIEDFETLSESLLKDGSFKLCFSCRRYPILSCDAETSIPVEHNNRDDILKFVEAKLEKLPPQLQKKLSAPLAKKAAGVFLWARLVVEKTLALYRRGESHVKILKAIDSTPKELHGLYEELLQGMAGEENDGAASLRLFQWVMYAEEPLRLAELRWALAIDPDTPCKSLEEYTESDCYVEDDTRLEMKTITLSFGLVEILPDFCCTVQFIHQDVADFFSNMARSEPAWAQLSPGISHDCLARTCAIYFNTKEVRAELESLSRLTEREAQKGWSPSDFQFGYYVAHSRFSHIRHSQGCGQDHERLLQCLGWPNSAGSFVRSWSSAIHIWQRGLVNPPMYRVYDELDFSSSCLHLAAAYDLVELVPVLQGKGVDIDVKDERGMTPFLLACYTLKLPAIQKLIECGASLDIRSADRRVALHHAAASRRLGDYPVVDQAAMKLLLSDSSVNAKDNMGDTPLAVLVHNRFMEDYNTLPARISQLLEAGANVNSRNRLGSTPLANLLEERYHWRPLKESNASAIQAVVRQLLDAGADATLRDGRGMTPLAKLMVVHTADKSGELAVRTIFRLLLEAGAGVDLKWPNGRPLLFGARSVAAIDALIDAKANLNARDNRGLTAAMHGLCISRKIHFWKTPDEVPPAVMTYLLDHSDVDAMDNKGRTVLFHLCLRIGMTGIRRFREHELLERDPSKPLLDHLLKCAANVNLANYKNQSPLHHLVGCLKRYEGRKPAPWLVWTIRALVRAGADLNQADVSGRSPSTLAAGRQWMLDILDVEKKLDFRQWGGSSLYRDYSYGDEWEDDESDGDESDGDESDGDELDGVESDGDESDCYDWDGDE